MGGIESCLSLSGHREGEYYPGMDLEEGNPSCDYPLSIREERLSCRVLRQKHATSSRVARRDPSATSWGCSLCNSVTSRNRPISRLWLASILGVSSRAIVWLGPKRPSSTSWEKPPTM